MDIIRVTAELMEESLLYAAVECGNICEMQMYLEKRVDRKKFRTMMANYYLSHSVEVTEE